jgi:hypothetical protein
MGQSSPEQDHKPSLGTLSNEEINARFKTSADWVNWEYDRMLQEAYDRGEFSPRGHKRLKSGLVLEFLVPPEPVWSDF